MPALSIVDARPEHAEELRELQRRASLVSEDAREQLLSDPDAIALPAGAIAAGQVRVAVTAGGLVAGFAVLGEAIAGVCELEALFVEPAIWRGGVGRMLVQDASARAAALGARAIEVTAKPGAVEFYERAGFVATGEAVQTRLGAGARMRAITSPT